MKSERMGLLMVAASLLVIGLIFGLFFHYQQQQRLQRIEVQGIGLARLLSSLDLPRLAPPQARQGILEVIRSLQTHSEFAYAVVEKPEGTPLREVTMPGIIAPPAPPLAGPSTWFGRRSVEDGPGGHRFEEFFAPVLSADQRVAQVRLGYRYPRLFSPAQDLSHFAMIALPVFLLVPLFYQIMKREVFSLKAASSKIEEMLSQHSLTTVELKASGEVQEFVRNFNRVVQAAEIRIQSLEQTAEGILTSANVLSYQKSRIESVLQSLPDAVIVLDEDSSVTFANKKLALLIGRGVDEIIGRKPEEWCDNEHLVAMMASLKAGSPRNPQDSRIELVPNGAPEKHISVSAYPLFSPREENNVFGNMVVFHDDSAEHLAREARKEFTARLAHELKTPLHVIGMYNEVLRDDPDPGGEIHLEAVNVIQDELERTTNLVSNMLNIAEIEMGSTAIARARTRLNDFLKDIYENISRGADAGGIQCELDLGTDLGSASIDKEMMRVAINNLITNAIKYNRTGGRVTLSARETDQEYVIAVSDTGLGISGQDQARVFDRFFRSDQEEVRARKGNGLGLALCREIVELHDGELLVESRLEEGSTFSIALRKADTMLANVI